MMQPSSECGRMWQCSSAYPVPAAHKCANVKHSISPVLDHVPLCLHRVFEDTETVQDTRTGGMAKVKSRRSVRAEHCTCDLHRPRNPAHCGIFHAAAGQQQSVNIVAHLRHATHTRSAVASSAYQPR